MARGSNTVLGLPRPEHPVDVNAPRTTRKRRADDGGLSSDDMTQTVPNVHPSKPSKTSSSTVSQETPVTTNPNGLTVPYPPNTASQVAVNPPKKKKAKKSAPGPDPSHAGDAALHDTVPEETIPKAPPKNKKNKQSAAPIPHDNINMDVNVSQPGSIVFGGSLVPSDPPKQPSRKGKAKGTQAPTLDADTLDADTLMPVNQDQPNPSTKKKAKGQARNDMVGSGLVNNANHNAKTAVELTPRSGGEPTRVRAPSAVAQQALEQDNAKLHAKELKEQRKKQRAQNAVIKESPEETAAFLAATNASGNVPTNIKIRPAAAPSQTSRGLKSKRQNEANRLIAQQVAQRVISNASPPVSASGSEHPGSVSDYSRAQSLPRNLSRAPSVSNSSSRGVSVAPSTRSIPYSLAHSESSRAISSQPPTRPGSPRQEVLDSVSAGLTLAELYEDMPDEFLPPIPEYKPLPPPLREPERTNPVPHRDINRLSPAERRQYTKDLKLSIKDLTPNDQIIVSSVLSRLEALVNTIDCFPSEDTAWQLMQVANAWGCRKHNRGNLHLVKGEPYEQLLSSRLSQTKTGILDFATSAIVESYGLRKLDQNQPEIARFNKDTVAYWLKDLNFTCPTRDFGALYERPVFADILKNAFFKKYNSTGVVHRDLFATVPITTIAGVATALEKALLEFETGVQVKQSFTRSFRLNWCSHVATLCDMYKSPAGDRLIKHLSKLSATLLAPFPIASDNTTTVVAPRIFSVSNRYGQSVVAPPPPTLPGAVSYSAASPSVLGPSASTNKSSTATQKARPTPRAKATTPALVSKVAPVAPQPPADSSSEESDLDETPGADVGDPGAWAQSTQASTTSAQQYDALNQAMGGESSDEQDDPGLNGGPPAVDSDSEDDDDDDDDDDGDGDEDGDKDGSVGEGNTGIGPQMASAKVGSQMDSDDGDDDDDDDDDDHDHDHDHDHDDHSGPETV